MLLSMLYHFVGNASMVKCVEFTLITQVLMHSCVEGLNYETAMMA
jgi:hypothetical protein